MIYFICLALGLTAFLMVLNDFLYGAKKAQIKLLLSILLLFLIGAAFIRAIVKSGVQRIDQAAS